MEKYKILRFAYTNEETFVIVPDGTKFFKIDEFKTKVEWEDKKNLTNCTYVAIVPYTKKNWKTLSNDKQTFSLNVYNLVNEYIILRLDQIYPLEELPITDIPPSIEHPIYCKWYNLNHKMENWCTDYIKVNSTDGEYFDCTVVNRRGWYDEEIESNSISREMLETSNLIRESHKEKTVQSTKEEFNKNFEEVLSKLKE